MPAGSASPAAPALRESDRLRVIAPPPLIFCAAVVLGLLLDRLWRLPEGLSPAVPWAGALLLALGLAGILAAATRFRAFSTPLEPGRPVTSLVTGGVYRLTRNPIYCGMALVCAGVALLAGDPWILIALVGALMLVHHGVVLREEAYLARRFGPDYLRYKADVRRWL